MEASYYPGCSLHGMAVEYDDSVKKVCQALDITLTELPDWNCCGASSAHFLDPELAVSLPARNMLIAEGIGNDVLVPCSACYQRLKYADKEMKKDPARWAGGAYEGKAGILHINEFFDRPEILIAIKRKVSKPLAGLKCVAYYGCLSQRPPRITDSGSPENPESMDRILRALGVDLKPWSYKTDCCGASLTLTRPDVVRKMSGDLLEGALEAGAECLVTDCPMCQSNIDTREEEIGAERGKSYNLPVFYITELMALAFGDRSSSGWWSKHFVNPTALLRHRGLLLDGGD